MPDEPATTPLSPRRRELLAAALHVVADEGLRGLTHRAVDRRAGLPEGSCSAYFRTRRALQTALGEYVTAALAADVSALADELRACPGGDDRAAELTGQLFLRWLDERELLQAKLELSLEASRDADLAALLGASRAQLVQVVAGTVEARGWEYGTARAEALVASFDGILVAALPKHEPERREFLSRSLELLMGALASPSGSPPDVTNASSGAAGHRIG